MPLYKRILERKNYSLLLFFLCLFILPATASATPVSINFSGEAVCVAPTLDGDCGAEGNFTATFQFDPATDSIVGAFSATSSDLTSGFPFASPDVPGSTASVQAFNGEDFFDFSGEGIDLELVFSTQNLKIPVAASVQVCLSNPGDCSVGEFVSGVSPEPSSLLLLATGLLGLGPFLLRRRLV